MSTVDVVSRDPEIQSAYEAMIANGQAPKLAEMLAFKTAPGCKTDATLMAVQHSLGKKRLPRIYYAKAKAAGVSTDDKYYEGAIARFPGDPRAWVDSRGHIKKVCEEEGWACEGEVKVKGLPSEEPDDDGEYRVAEDLVHKEVAELGRKDPSLVDTPRALERTIHETRDLLSGKD